MIFLTVGTQKFQFNRLLAEIDHLVHKGIITEPIIAQIGHSTYRPRHYKAVGFMSGEEYDAKIRDCDLLITHGGVGTILKGLEHGKKIIVVPRKKIFFEHVDDHQKEVAGRFEEMGYVHVCRVMSELENCYKNISNFSPSEFHIHYSNVRDFINNYLESIERDPE